MKLFTTLCFSRCSHHILSPRGRGSRRASASPRQRRRAEAGHLSETKILKELVRKVAAETGVALNAACEVAMESVAVVVKELAGELLEQVAELLDYCWSRRGKPGEPRGMRSGRTCRRSSEAALREQQLREVLARFRKELTRTRRWRRCRAEEFERQLTTAAAKSRARGPGSRPVRGPPPRSSGTSSGTRMRSDAPVAGPAHAGAAAGADARRAVGPAGGDRAAHLLNAAGTGRAAVSYRRLSAGCGTRSRRHCGWWPSTPTGEDEEQAPRRGPADARNLGRREWLRGDPADGCAVVPADRRAHTGCLARFGVTQRPAVARRLPGAAGGHHGVCADARPTTDDGRIVKRDASPRGEPTSWGRGRGADTGAAGRAVAGPGLRRHGTARHRRPGVARGGGDRRESCWSICWSCSSHQRLFLADSYWLGYCGVSRERPHGADRSA